MGVGLPSGFFWMPLGCPSIKAFSVKSDPGPLKYIYTHFPKTGPKYHKSRFSQNSDLVTQRGICHPTRGQNALFLCPGPFLIIFDHFGDFSKIVIFWPFKAISYGPGVLGDENDTKSQISRAWRPIFKIRKKNTDAKYNYLTNKKRIGSKLSLV